MGSGLIILDTRELSELVKIKGITDFLMQEERVSLKQRLDMPYENEIGIISKSLNQMLDKVEPMTRKTVENQTMLYEVKLAEQQAKQLALQSQINPCFLNNTLNCLSSIGLSYDVAEVVDISTATANIFRYSIKGDDMANVREEIDCIQEYLCIMDIRYSGKFDVTILVDDSLMDIQTLKMILQPIVENSTLDSVMEQHLSLRQGELLVFRWTGINLLSKSIHIRNTLGRIYHPTTATTRGFLKTCLGK